MNRQMDRVARVGGRPGSPSQPGHRSRHGGPEAGVILQAARDCAGPANAHHRGVGENLLLSNPGAGSERPPPPGPCPPACHARTAADCAGLGRLNLEHSWLGRRSGCASRARRWRRPMCDGLTQAQSVLLIRLDNSGCMASLQLDAEPGCGACATKLTQEGMGGSD